MSQTHERLLLNDAREKEKKCDWAEAREIYEKLVADCSPKVVSKASEFHELIGFCLLREAMQAESTQQFKSRMTKAASEYDIASSLIEKVQGASFQARVCHCRAMAMYARSQLKSEPVPRKEALAKCYEYQEERLKLVSESGDTLSLSNTYLELSSLLADIIDLEWDVQARKKMLRDAISYGEKAISILSKLMEQRELAKALCMSSIHHHMAAIGLEDQDRLLHIQKALDQSKQAVALSESNDDVFLLSLSHIWLGSAIADFTEDQEVAEPQFKIALKFAVNSKDNYLLGRASYLMAHISCWAMFTEQDPNRKLAIARTCQEYSDKALRHFMLAFQDQEVASSYYCIAESYSVLAMSIETDLEKKRLLLKKSIVAGKKGLQFARQSGSANAIWFILHPLSKSLYYLSTLEPKSSVRKNLLRKALQYRKENLEALTVAMPYYFWNQGVYSHYKALIQAGLSSLEQDRVRQAGLLDEAVKSAEDCVNLCQQPDPLSRQQYVAIGKFHSDLGEILQKLRLLTGKNELLHRLIDALRGALKAYELANLPNCAAECHWKLANANNELRNYDESAKSFGRAAENYLLAAEKAEKTSSLRDFYLDHACFMKGWSEIEKARHHHGTDQYIEAEKTYKKAAEIFETTRSWKYLALNFLACARVEHAEDLSRKEQNQQAFQAFKEAAALLAEARYCNETAAKAINDADERQRAVSLTKATESRQEYCQGRLLLEEAKIEDAHGNVWQSLEKYGMASSVLQKLTNELEDSSERARLCSVVLFCQAWNKMKLAEMQLTPSLYLEASALFLEAKKSSLSENLSLLAQGNSALCEALAAAMKFETTKDSKLYSLAKQKMESAANYHLRAKVEKTSTWIGANQALLDAYFYMNKAETDTIPKKKVEAYSLAEMCLQRSADLCKKAGYSGKREEVLRILASLRGKEEFTISLGATLKPPPLAPSASMLSFPASIQEEAVGVERFEHVSIHSSAYVPEEATVGEVFTLRVDIANVAKENGILARIDGIIPPELVVVRKPDSYEIEGGSIIARGIQLVPQKVESIEISLQASNTGNLQISPTIVYVDEQGGFKKCGCRPVQIAVLPPANFQFKTANSQQAFEYLVREFANDYMKRRLTLEKSGWRTFVQIQVNAKIPKSSVYGTAKRRGYVIAELERRRLVETRTFEGERGRGGRITKTRIYYERDIIKRYVDLKVMKIQEK